MNKDSGIRNFEDSIRWQKDVYLKANEVASLNGLKTILDLGCGNPAKLVRYLSWVDEIYGVDYPSKMLNIAAAASAADGNAKTRWIGHDLDFELNLNRKFGIVIAADVIEHINNLEEFFKTVKNHMDENSRLVISSPEKRTVTSCNPLHVQEFTCEELAGVLHAEGFKVIESFGYQEASAAPPYTNNVFVCMGDKNGNSNKT